MNLLKSLTVATIAVFAPAKSMILASLALVIMDLITGILAARKQGLPITSAGLGRTVSKLLVYEAAILLAFVAQQYLLSSLIPAASIVSGVVGITELTSCLENLNIIGGNNILQSIIDKISSANKS